MHALFDDVPLCQHLSEYCCTINNLFTFAGIGVTEGFQHFSPASGPPAVAITGRTYHLIRNTKYMEHSIHWFLYDESMHNQKALQLGVHATIIQAVKDDLLLILMLNTLITFIHLLASIVTF